MDYVLEAKYVYVEDDGDVLTIGFADDEFTPQKYVLLQKGLKPDEQDKRLDMDKTHIEIDDQVKSGYGGISSIRYVNGELLVVVTEAAKKFLRIDGDVKITLPDDVNMNEKMLTKLASVSEDEFVLERVL